MYKRLVVLAFVVACIAMQVRAFWTAKRYYPFVNYAMYCSARQPPVAATKTSLMAHLPDGREVMVTPAYMGLNWHAWWHEVAVWLTDDLVAGPKEADIVARRRQEALVLVREQIHRVEGVLPASLEVVRCRYRLEADCIVTGITGERFSFASSAEVTP